MGAPPVKPAEYAFAAARRRLEAKPKSAAEKLTSLEDAVARIKDGDHVAVGGCLFSRTPMALVRELLRARRRGLTLSRNLTCTEGEFLMVAGAVERIVTAWMSIGLPWGSRRSSAISSSPGGSRSRSGATSHWACASARRRWASRSCH